MTYRDITVTDRLVEKLVDHIMNVPELLDRADLYARHMCDYHKVRVDEGEDLIDDPVYWEHFCDYQTFIMKRVTERFHKTDQVIINFNDRLGK